MQSPLPGRSPFFGVSRRIRRLGRAGLVATCLMAAPCLSLAPAFADHGPAEVPQAAEEAQANTSATPATSAIPPAPTVPARSTHTMRRAAETHLAIGAAVEPRYLDNPAYAALLAREFNSVTAENAMKPMAVHARRGELTFEAADRLVDFAEEHHMQVIGHVLVWHQSSPSWLFENQAGEPLPREEALANMREHIHAVVGHYRGRVRGWDVVNEAISDTGPYLRDTPALRAIGEDYVIKAFEFAHEADPNAELYYNDYNIAVLLKRAKALRLVNELLDAGVRLDAVGVQGHWLVDWPSVGEIKDGLDAFLDLGVSVDITELDIDPLPRQRAGGADISAIEQAGDNPYVDGMPEEAQQKLARRYAELFDLFLSEPGVRRVTLWGVDDGASWLNFFPVQGRTNHPLLFDRDLQPKPAYYAVLNSLRRHAGLAPVAEPARTGTPAEPAPAGPGEPG